MNYVVDKTIILWLLHRLSFLYAFGFLSHFTWIYTSKYKKKVIDWIASKVFPKICSIFIIILCNYEYSAVKTSIFTGNEISFFFFFNLTHLHCYIVCYSKIVTASKHYLHIWQNNLTLSVLPKLPLQLNWQYQTSTTVTTNFKKKFCCQQYLMYGTIQQNKSMK